MSIDPSKAKRIALITDDFVKFELIRAAHRDLNKQVSQSSGDLKEFAGMTLMEPLSSTEKARTEYLDDEALRSTLGLIVLDGAVRAQSVGGTSSSSAPAMLLLDWLTETIPEAPVVVLVTAGVSGLTLRQTKRKQRNIRLLDLGEGNFPVAFAKALHGISSGARTARQRLTVRVGEYQARYYMMEGDDVRERGAYAYHNPAELNRLLDKINAFTPFRAGKALKNWHDEFKKFGDDVFNSFIAGTIGHHIVEHYRNERRSGAPVDLRFDIEVDPYENARLFNLPFELAKPPEYGDDFLCTRLPMARRIRFLKRPPQVPLTMSGERAVLAQSAGQAEDGDHDQLAAEREPDTEKEDSEDNEDNDHGGGNAIPVTHSRPLKVLFINASFAGSALIYPEVPGDPLLVKDLTELENTPNELKKIKAFGSSKLGHKLDPVISVALNSRIRKHDQFKDKMKELIISGKFDILHFSGHSMTLPGKGGTFLVLPDETGQGEGVSVREMAQWIKESNIRIVLLSSCSGSSLRTAIEMIRTGGAEAVIGFRWDVMDRACVDFFENFYASYLGKNMSIAEAYCEACEGVKSSMFGFPIWCSAVAVVRN